MALDTSASALVYFLDRGGQMVLDSEITITFGTTLKTWCKLWTEAMSVTAIPVGAVGMFFKLTSGQGVVGCRIWAGLAR